MAKSEGVMGDNRSFYSSWYYFLKEAIKSGIPINRAAYEHWGTPEELSSWSFNKWWTTRGQQIAAEASRREARVTRITRTAVTIEFPISMTSKAVRAQASAAIAKIRREMAAKALIPQEKRFNYKNFKILEKVLSLETSSAMTGATHAARNRALAEVFRKQGEVNKKRLLTLRQRAKEFDLIFRRDGRKEDQEKAALYRRRAGSLEQWIKRQESQWTVLENEELLATDPSLQKKLYRWSTQARILMLNAAAGEFTGDGWYGDRIGSTVARRMKRAGVIAKAGQRNKGGKNKYQKTRSQRSSGKGGFGLLTSQ
ncbi:MAG: hypothetical protein FJY62_00490 [Betaproteobacteria bacterium]|nr:hypothetical protein [Betaproteobacteria bacterium]